MNADWELIWSLFHYAILSSALTGIVCPLIGCFLLVRRTGFYGVALPQFAAAGVALGWALPVWWMQAGWSEIDLEVVQLESPHAVKNYLLGLAALTTFGGLLALQLIDRRKETETGRVAAAFAIASAMTVLLAGVSPHGGEMVGQLLRGEILTADLHEFETIACVYGAVLLTTLYFLKPLLLTSFDPDAARIGGISVRHHESLLLLLVGTTVSVGVLIVGPIVLFGLLVIPPLAAQTIARSMRGMFVAASALGLLAALGGVVISFELDLPLGPSVVSAAGLELLPALAFARWRRA
ncbi:MAG: metal ABC transporter permease [Planctomycetota bacterium]|jgi:ABC-type Mn2+/Zn2+ transport system permease subunit|nr:metal ABC transporter permease [Planctomycetota bacterium]